MHYTGGMDELSSLLGMLLGAAPGLLLYLLAAGWSVTNLRDHPQPARLSLIGLVLMALGAVGSRVSQWALLVWVLPDSGSEQYTLLAAISSLVFGCLYLCSVGLLLAAAWSGRELAQP